MKRSRRDTLDMTVGSPTKVLLLFAVPLILSNLFQQLYNMIDSLIVGNYLGADALAAVGSAGTITAVMVQVASGLALGASVVIAQYFGAGKRGKIRLCMTTICLFSVIVGILMTVIAQVFAREILRMVKTPDGIMNESVKYLTIYFWGSVAIFLYNALQAVYIAMGDSRTPLYFLMMAFLVNVVGDMYFIVQWKMGVSGGALATTLSQVLCTILSFVVLERKLWRMGIERTKQLFDKTEFVRMMKIAVPAALQQSVVSLGNVCVQAVTNSFGPMVMAGCAAANKAVNLISVIPINWGNALSNYVSQNIGAKKTERISQGVRVSLLVTGVLSILTVFLMERIPKIMIGWFVEGEGADRVIQVGASYLQVVGWSLPVFSGYMVIKSVFKGVGDMNWFVGLTLGSLGVRVGCAFWLTPDWGVEMLWWSVVIGWGVAAVPTLGYYISGRWRERRII